MDPKLIEQIEENIAKKYISKRKHPHSDMYILNYTNSCQFDQAWNKATIMCRGLIVNENYDILYRPFPKFFNLDQWRSLKNHVYNLFGVSYKNAFKEPVSITEKMDGSLGIIYLDEDQNFSICTRGSFASEQALVGTKLLREKYPHICPNPHLTYLVEIIYPENKIVVDYKGESKLVLLACIDNQTGLDCDIYGRPGQYNLYGKLPIVPSFPVINDWKRLGEQKRKNFEGYVIRFASGLRVKIKLDEYMVLHRILTCTTNKTVLESLASGRNPLVELGLRIPDEFCNWLINKVADYEMKFLRIGAFY